MKSIRKRLTHCSLFKDHTCERCDRLFVCELATRAHVLIAPRGERRNTATGCCLEFFASRITISREAVFISAPYVAAARLLCARRSSVFSSVKTERSVEEVL
ncbi:hypothetical protein EVAR_56848_1 [Eumeta japonica]|uniref:C2H2-type domain-containing protein n=1 Tax=Eumeta variegata TaxID=151549 RepID=A0A4C1ZEC1_EUMVA|nr:hypothetical protein EVAR_56848_1 [Eumeta japonica]